MIKGVIKEDYSDYTIYYIEELSDELKNEIRSRLVAICHGVDQLDSKSKIYSYKETVKEFVKRCTNKKESNKSRKKGMIGELLVHVILELEGRFTTASPFFNMEERSFKKGFDVALLENATDELWIAEVKSGEMQKCHKNPSSAIKSLINTAKKDLEKRLNDSDSSLWLNAINAAKVSMKSNTCQKDAVVELLGQYADDVVCGKSSSVSCNVVLSANLFHKMSERIEAEKVSEKYEAVVGENMFKKVFVMVIQKETYKAVYDFLESEVDYEV